MPNKGWAKPLRKLLWICDSAPVWALALVLIALAAMKKRAAVWRCESAMRMRAPQRERGKETKREEGRGKREEGRGKREEGRGKREEGQTIG
ncbi:MULTISPECIES: hypothetical protein [unclassified Acidovorax]|uniref:hypothetical protein n=1 Tax=unclassified Acidovorax TaxID=2684926 RepID=UPI001F2CE69E|nr:MULTISPECIES: hypothetical protein [unclassified Acidovorax]